MGIVYRVQKKEPLTMEEMDGNFANLDERLKHLETKPVLAEGLEKIVQEGDKLTFHGMLGTLLGQVTLPKAFPNPRGKWQPYTPYCVLDWIQVDRSVYSCTLPHTSTKFEDDLGNWALVFEV